MHAGHAGTIPAGIIFLWMGSFRVHGIWEIDITGGFYGTGTETTRKHTYPTGIVWMGTGNKDFHANHLGGNGKSRFLRGLFEWDHRSDICPGTGINPNSCEILRDFARGNLSEDCP